MLNSNNPILFVTWRSPNTRSIKPVGRLAFDQDSGHYEFRYIQSAQQAVVEGFTPFPEFPKLDAIYRGTELFPLFANRLMPPSRPDYPAFLTKLDLAADRVNPMAILARTGGSRKTDQIELIPWPNLDSDGCYVTYFFLRSVQYMPRPVTEERIAKLVPDEELLPKPDPLNPVDVNAISVWTNDDFKIGYLPSYLTTDLQVLQNERPTLRVYVSRVNPPPAEAHHRVLCRMVSSWPAGFRPFDSDGFQPLSKSPEQLVGADFAKAGR